MAIVPPLAEARTEGEIVVDAGPSPPGTWEAEREGLAEPVVDEEDRGELG